MTDMETLLRMVSDLRTEIMAALARMEERTVQRGEYLAHLGTLDQQFKSLERRVSTLESDRKSTRLQLIYPALVVVLGVVLTWALTTRGGG